MIRLSPPLRGNSWMLRGLLLCSLLLTGCAARQAFWAAERLRAQGQEPAALQKYEEATRADPSAVEYRLAYLTQRDRLVNAWVAEADRRRLAGQLQEAEALYVQALTAQANHPRAQAGYKLLERQRAVQAWLADAEQAKARKDWKQVQARMRNLLAEQPDHPAAQALLQQAEAALSVEAPEGQLAASFRKPVTLEFRDAPLRSVFDLLARSAGLNFVFDRDLRLDTQRATLQLRDSTVETALGLLLSAHQLDYKPVNANTVLLYAATAAKQKEHQSLRIRSYYLSHAEAKAVANTVRSLAKPKDVVVDDKLNLLMVRDSADVLRLVDRLVALHDVPEGEVMLDVEVLEVKRSRLTDLGVRWPDQLSFTPLAGSSGATLTVNDLRQLDSTRIGVGVGNLVIAAGKTDADANILANPRLRTRNREKAKVLIGERVPNITSTATATGFVSESVSYVDVGLKLEAEPTLYTDGEVLIRLNLEVSNIINQVQTKAGSLAYQIGTRSAQTVLRLKDGENQILAGLISDEERDSANKLPGLGDLPLLGRLFGRHSDNQVKTEIVLSITPRVLRGGQRPPAELLDFDAGTEANLSSRAGSGPTNSSSLPASRAAEERRQAPPETLPLASAPPTTSANPGAGSATPSTFGAPAAASNPGVDASSGVSTGTPVATAVPTVAPRAFWHVAPLVRKGEEVLATLMLQSDVPLTQVPLTLQLDPAQWELLEVLEGPFMGLGGGKGALDRKAGAGNTTNLLVSRNGPGGATGLSPLLSLRLKVQPGAKEPLSLAVRPGPLVGLEGRPVPTTDWPPLVIKLQP